MIKYVSPKSPMAPDAKDELVSCLPLFKLIEKVTTTVKDYDLAQTSSAMKGMFVVSHFPRLLVTVAVSAAS